MSNHLHDVYAAIARKAMPISEHTGMPYDPEWGYQPQCDPALIDHDEVPSLWSMLSRLFRRKPKLSMSFRESLGPHIVIEAEYDGKRYQGVLYPIEGKEDNA